MYDRAAKITNKRVRTSNVFIGHHPPLKLEDIQQSENHILLSFQLYTTYIVSQRKRNYNIYTQYNGCMGNNLVMLASAARLNCFQRGISAVHIKF